MSRTEEGVDQGQCRQRELTLTTCKNLNNRNPTRRQGRTSIKKIFTALTPAYVSILAMNSKAMTRYIQDIQSTIGRYYTTHKRKWVGIIRRAPKATYLTIVRGPPICAKVETEYSRAERWLSTCRARSTMLSDHLRGLDKAEMP